MDEYYGTDGGAREYPDPATCYHRFVTGADGAVYCRVCGAVLRSGNYGAYREERDARPPAGRSRTAVVLVVVAVLLAGMGAAAWVYFGRKPAPVASSEKAEPIDLGMEPVQVGQAEAVLVTRADGMTLVSIARYRIAGKVICVRAYAPFGEGSSGFPIDLGLAWGDVGKADYEKYVHLGFSNEYAANQWLMYTYDDELPWPLSYFGSHVSNNHICPATENLYNALMSLEKNDLVILEGYLAESRDASGNRVLSSSTSRSDSEAGACEAFFVEKLQVGDAVYR